MSIDARISAVVTKPNGVILRLASYQHSDGTMSIRGVEKVAIIGCTKPPHAGQKIWGSSSLVVVEAGHGGKRMEYNRTGMRLYERKGGE